MRPWQVTVHRTEPGEVLQPDRRGRLRIVQGTQGFGCPKRHVSAGAREFLAAYRPYSNGVMPFAGGSEEQPARVMAALQVIDTAVNEWERNRQKAAREEAEQRRQDAAKR